MLNFRSASILMVILAVLVLLLMIFQPQSWWLLIPVATFYLLMLVLGSVDIRSGFYLQAQFKGDTSEKIVTLTFDDGPDPVNTPKILEILEKYHVPATFFVVGHKARQYEDLLMLIDQNGHLIGNHSFSHAFFFDLFGRKKMEQDLLKAEGIIKKLTGRRPLLFRPPYGVTNPTVAKVVKKLGYKVIGWSARSLDTTIKDAEKIAGRVIGKLHPGAVILMHDTQNITPAALEKVINKAKDKGYRFVGLEEMFSFEAYEN